MRKRALARGLRYARRVNKVIREILLLLWRVLRTYFWKWLRPRIGKLLFALLVVVAIIGTLTVLIASSC